MHTDIIITPFVEMKVQWAMEVEVYVAIPFIYCLFALVSDFAHDVEVGGKEGGREDGVRGGGVAERK